MSHMLETQAFLDAVCELLRQGETNIAIPVTGGSMVPFLHSGDMAYLNLPDTPLKKGDIVLYTRATGQYILHRICKINSDGSFLMVGDAQQTLEHLAGADQIHARVTSVRHEEKLYRPGMPRWWIYQHVWLWLRPVRRRLMKLRGMLKVNK